MNKIELIFSIIAVIAYIILSIILQIPLYIHIMFGCILLGALFIALLLKLNQKYENEKINKIFYMITIILIAFYTISLAYEAFYNKTLILPSGLIVIFVFITLIIKWIFNPKK